MFRFAKSRASGSPNNFQTVSTRKTLQSVNAPLSILIRIFPKDLTLFEICFGETHSAHDDRRPALRLMFIFVAPIILVLITRMCCIHASSL